MVVHVLIICIKKIEKTCWNVTSSSIHKKRMLLHVVIKRPCANIMFTGSYTLYENFKQSTGANMYILQFDVLLELRKSVRAFCSFW